MKKLCITLMSAFAILFTLEWNDMSDVQAEGLREEAIKIAAAEVGYHEKETMDDLYDHTANSGDKNYTKYAVDLCVAYGQPWGAAFFWWVMSQTGVPREAYPNYVSATTDWFRERNAYHDRGTYTPQPGDYAVLGNVANCGIVESVTETEVTVIAGNRGDTNAVTRFTVSLDDEYIKGYGEIDYDYVYQPTSLDFSDNYCAMMFKTSVGKYYRNYQNEPVLWSELNRADQKWLFKKQDDGTYMIQSLYDGKVLEVKDAGTTRATLVTLGTIKAENNDHQKWYIMQFGVGHRLIPKNATNFCLDIYGDTDATKMQIWQHNEGMSQMTTFTEIPFVELKEIKIKSLYKETMHIDETQILEYKLSPEDASADMIVWESSDASIATVDESGIVTAKKEGNVTISCKSTFDSNVLDAISIKVEKEVTQTPPTENDPEESIEQQNPTDDKEQGSDETENITGNEEDKGSESEKPVKPQNPTDEKPEDSTQNKEQGSNETENTTGKDDNKGTELEEQVKPQNPTDEKPEDSTQNKEQGSGETENTTGQEENKATEKEDMLVKEGASFTSKKCKFVITNLKKKTVKVTGVKNKKAIALMIPDTVKYEGVTYKVTKIEKNAFKKNKMLKKVTIGNNVKTIGDRAFCECKNLKKIVIGKGVTTIGKSACYGCSNLKTIEINSLKLKKVGSKAFKKIHRKAVIYTPEKKKEEYKRLFKGKI